MSRCRSVIGFIAGRSTGFPEGRNPSITSSFASSGRCFATGSSSFSFPCSTSCIAATEVIALVIEAIWKMESGWIAIPEARSRLPNAAL